MPQEPMIGLPLRAGLLAHRQYPMKCPVRRPTPFTPWFAGQVSTTRSKYDVPPAYGECQEGVKQQNGNARLDGRSGAPAHPGTGTSQPAWTQERFPHGPERRPRPDMPSLTCGPQFAGLAGDVPVIPAGGRTAWTNRSDTAAASRCGSCSVMRSANRPLIHSAERPCTSDHALTANCPRPPRSSGP